MQKYILTLDQGTTNSRAIIFNRSGQIVASQQEELKQIFPKPGWVEHNPIEIWETQLNAARQVLKKQILLLTKSHPLVSQIKEKQLFYGIDEQGNRFIMQ